MLIQFIFILIALVVGATLGLLVGEFCMLNDISEVLNLEFEQLCDEVKYYRAGHRK